VTVSAERLKAEIAIRARNLGFDQFGVAEATPLVDERERLREWLRHGNHATMTYIERLETERIDPGALLEGAKSVLCFASNYYHPDPPGRSDVHIARYARGRDYHRVLRSKLKSIAALITSRYPDAATRICVDTAPILEKAWAERAGIGWRGKHSNLVSRTRGSWMFLGEMLTTVALPPDRPHQDFCGECRKCLDACPTDAFPRPYVLDARRCISYLTIEHKGAFEPGEGERIGGLLFGCDVCLEVCPWNRFQQRSGEADFAPREAVTSLGARQWRDIDDDTGDTILSGSAMRRAGLGGLRRNARQILKNHKE